MQSIELLQYLAHPVLEDNEDTKETEARLVSKESVVIVYLVYQENRGNQESEERKVLKENEGNRDLEEQMRRYLKMKQNQKRIQ